MIEKNGTDVEAGSKSVESVESVESNKLTAAEKVNEFLERTNPDYQSNSTRADQNMQAKLRESQYADQDDYPGY